MKNLFLLVAVILLTVVTASAQCNGQIYKISSAGKVMAYDNYGNWDRCISSNAIDVDCNTNIGIVVTHTTGSVQIYDKYGNDVRTITSDGSRARFNGDEVLVTKLNGKIYRYDKYGNVKDTI